MAIDSNLRDLLRDLIKNMYDIANFTLKKYYACLYIDNIIKYDMEP